MVNAFIGMPKTGKTFLAIKMVKKYIIETGHPVLCYDRSGDFFRAGVVPEKNLIRDYDDLVKKLFGSAEEPTESPVKKNLMVVLDDYKTMFKGNATPSKLRSLFIDNINYNIDIIMVCHSVNHLLADISAFLNTIYVFKNISNSSHIENKIMTSHVFNAMTEYIHLLTKEVGAKVIEKGSDGLYYPVKTGQKVENPIFPHFVLDMNNGFYENNTLRNINQI